MRLRCFLSLAAIACLAQPAPVTFIDPAAGEKPGNPKIRCGALEALSGYELR